MWVRVRFEVSNQFEFCSDLNLEAIKKWKEISNAIKSSKQTDLLLFNFIVNNEFKQLQ